MLMWMIDWVDGTEDGGVDFDMVDIGKVDVCLDGVVVCGEVEWLILCGFRVLIYDRQMDILTFVILESFSRLNMRNAVYIQFG